MPKGGPEGGSEPQLVSTPAALSALRTSWQGRSVGFVPTMGYLHEGHATLIRRARAENDVVVLSIFVNPLQFGPSEDLARYPRDLDRDLALAQQAGADFVFHPLPSDFYPEGFSTRVEVSGVAEPLDGAARPGHFAGVATVVLKLLLLVGPTRAYFGEKDWQQLMVVRRMVTDLHVPTEIVGVPTVREASGLAMSSRNTYLTEAEKDRATVLSRALRAVQQAYATGERRTSQLQQVGLDVLATEAAATPDYLAVVDSQLQTPERLPDADPWARVLVAARMFGVRLIDNVPLDTGAGAGAGQMGESGQEQEQP